MRLRLFRAASAAEALARVRAELGPDALILGTRRVAGGVECTAAIEDWVRPLEAARPAGREDVFGFHGVPQHLAERLSACALPAALASAFAFAPVPLAQTGPPLLLLGPPGAGKTLTAARLATRLVLAGQRPFVLTADGRRAGAPEELAAYTRLLGLDLVVATSPASLARALAHRPPGEAAIIDTEGVNPFDPAQHAAAACLVSVAAASALLVLPAGGDPAETAEIAAAFRDAGAASLLPSRLDAARRLGGVLAAADATRLPFTEASIGTGATDSLVPLTAAFLAERLVRGADAAHSNLETAA